jgi:AcrR family transcriptional regulator
MAQSETQPNPYRRSLLRQERSRQTRDALVHAALQLWRERGFDDTTIDDISAAAGVARSTYYFHFADKHALLRQVAGTSAATIGTAVTKANIVDLSLDEAMDTFSSELARYVERLPRDLVARITRSVLGGIGYLGEGHAADQSFAGQLQAIFETKRDNLQADVDTVELGAVAAGMVMEGILRWSLGTAKEAELRDVIQARMRLVLDGSRRR